MKFYEKNLEDLIWDYCGTPNKKQVLINRGFPDIISSGTLFRQFCLDSYGIADIVCIQKPLIDRKDGGVKNIYLRVDIFELKLNDCDQSTVLQVSGYMTAAKHFLTGHLERYMPFLKSGKHEVLIEVYGHVLGKGLRKDVEFLLDQTPKIFYTEYSFDLEAGLVFEMQEKGWYRTSFNPGNTSIHDVEIRDLFRSDIAYDRYVESLLF